MSRCHKFFTAPMLTAQMLAAAGLLLAAPSVAQEPKPDSDAIVFALMSGKCPMLKIAGRNYRCRAVAFSQTEQGRANFTIALDDPADNRHVVTFSGDHGVRPQDNLYELPIDQMQLKSRDRPEIDGLPVPLIEVSAGNCKLVGSLFFAAGFQHRLRGDQPERPPNTKCDSSPMARRSNCGVSRRRTPAPR